MTINSGKHNSFKHFLFIIFRQMIEQIFVWNLVTGRFNCQP